MKAFYKILAIVGACCMFASCEGLDIKNLNDESQFKAAELLDPSNIEITESDNTSVVTFSWESADFGQPVAVSYTIKGTYGNKTEELFVNLPGENRLTVTKYEVKASELAAKLIALGVPKGQTVKMQFTVTATTGTNFTVIESASKTVNVTIE